MKRHRIILQLESELAQAEAASADRETSPSIFDDTQFVDGYWHGRKIGLAAALAFLNDGGEQ